MIKAKNNPCQKSSDIQSRMMRALWKRIEPTPKRQCLRIEHVEARDFVTLVESKGCGLLIEAP